MIVQLLCMDLEKQGKSSQENEARRRDILINKGCNFASLTVRLHCHFLIAAQFAKLLLSARYVNRKKALIICPAIRSFN